jgi:hypothetical protein
VVRRRDVVSFGHGVGKGNDVEVAFRFKWLVFISVRSGLVVYVENRPFI